MQNGIGLERFAERFELSRGFGVIDGKNVQLQFDAGARQPRLVFAECQDEPRRWVVMHAWKAAKTVDEDAHGHRFHPSKQIEAGTLHDP